MTWILVMVLVVAVLGCFGWVWHVWQTRFASRMMDYDSREMAILAEAQVAVPGAASARVGLAETPPAAPLAQAMAVARPATPVQKTGQERPNTLLDEAGRMIFKDLKECVGDYPVTVAVDVARLINDAQVIPPRVQVDYLVCRKDFTPVVAIFLDRGNPDPLRERALQLLKQSRIRVLRWDVAAPPAGETMRQQIFKPKAGAETATH